MPTFKDGDFEIAQSGAIMRHLARKHNLYGANDQEKTRCDMIYDGYVDLRDKMLKLVFSKGDFVSLCQRRPALLRMRVNDGGAITMFMNGLCTHVSSVEDTGSLRYTFCHTDFNL